MITTRCTVAGDGRSGRAHRVAGRRGRALLVALACAAGVLAGCTRAASPPTTTSPPATTAARAPTSHPSATGRVAAGPTTAAAAGPTTAAAAGTCPLIDEDTVAADVGMRLDAITLLSSGGTVIGCRFYPLGHPTAQCPAACLAGEHLPPASQPAVQIVLSRYPSALAAHNEMARLADAGSNPQQVTVGSGDTGVAYQVNFYAADHGQDWACAFTVGATLVVISTATIGGSFDVTALAQHLRAHLG